MSFTSAFHVTNVTIILLSMTWRQVSESTAATEWASDKYLSKVFEFFARSLEDNYSKDLVQ